MPGKSVGYRIVERPTIFGNVESGAGADRTSDELGLA
jgi:hypothetical protein